MTRMASLFGQTRLTVFVATLGFVVLTSPGAGQAQETTITESGLNTRVTTSGATTFIDGGTRPGDASRPNLFHSFGDFSIGTGDTALFRAIDAVGGVETAYSGNSIQNIISRVTGTNPSSLFGTVDTQTNFPTANLFLVNPNGMLLGATATVNVGGSANFVAGDYLRMTDNALFYANPAQTSTLSVAAVNSFGFLAGNPLGTIQVEGGTVKNTSTLTLVGRDIVDGSGNTTTPGIAVTGGTLSDPGGRINLVSVGTPQNTAVGGEINVGDLNPSSTLRFNSMGIVRLFPNTSIITTANAAGPIFIRAGRLVMDASSRLRAATMDAPGGNITIEVQRMGLAGTSGDVQDFSYGAFVSTSTFGTGQGGDIIVNATESVTITDNHTGFGSLPGALTGLFSTSSKTGNSGKIFVSTPALSITGLGGGITTQTFSTEAGGGRAGDITLDVGTLIFRDGAQLLSNTNLFSTGNAGNLKIFASDLVEVDGGPSSDRLSRINSGTSGFGDGGNVLIESPRLTIDRGTIRAESDTQVLAKAGNITIDVDHLTITNGEGILTTSRGPAGDIVINANDSIEISRSRGISSQALGSDIAGNIYITTPTLSIVGGGLERAGVPNGINSSTGSTGAAGNIVLNVDKVTLTNAAEITSSSISNLLGGNAGTITLQGSTGRGSSATTVSLDNSTISTTTAAPNPTNTPANIEIKAQTVTLDNGAQIKADTSGATPAGNIALNVDTLTAGNSSISSTSTFTNSTAGNAGNITIQGINGANSPADNMTLDNSTISTTVAGETLSSVPANITIAAQAVTLSNGVAITASTTGNAPAGNIGLVTQQLTMTPDSAITSNAQTGGTGKAGAITITGAGSAPTTIAGGTIQAQSETIAIAGDITLHAPGDLTLLGTRVSVKNTGPGSAGSIDLRAGDNLLVRNSRVSTESAEASGGNIKLTAPNIIRLVDSTLTSSVQGQAGSNGGNINIDPQLVVIQNSQLLAKANAGAGGIITIAATGAVLVDPNSLLSATAGPAGISGTVNINAPIQVLSGALVPLNLAYSQAALSGDRCAADPTGQFSSFVQAGRDGVPQVPGALSPSPLSFLETLTSGSLGSPTSNWAAARLGLDYVSVDDSTRYWLHSACRS